MRIAQPPQRILKCSTSEKRRNRTVKCLHGVIPTTLRGLHLRLGYIKKRSLEFMGDGQSGAGQLAFIEDPHHCLCGTGASHVVALLQRISQHPHQRMCSTDVIMKDRLR